jgi:TRAP-type mannitol/chloroaromatic compound transport system permease large subunit
MDPTQFDIMLLINLGLGLCTPPVGTCLFVGSAVGKIKIEEALKTIWPFYLAIFVALMLVTYIPAVSLWLPSLYDGSDVMPLALCQGHHPPTGKQGRPTLSSAMVMR